MPQINPFTGQIVMGFGDGPLSVDGTVLLSSSGSPCWLDAHRILCQVRDAPERYRVIAYDLLTGKQEELAPHGANSLAARGGGRWLGWLDHVGLFGAMADPIACTSRAGNEGRGAAAPDGTLAVTPVQQDYSPTRLYAPDGSMFQLPVDALDLYVMGPREAIWNGGATFDTGPLLPGAVRVRAVDVAGIRYFVYWTEEHGLVAHAKGTFLGWSLETRPLAFNFDAAAIDDERIVVAWSESPSELPQFLRKVADVFALPLRRLDTVTVPPVGRALWLGWFEFGNPPSLPPGNCTLAVRRVTGPQARPVIITDEQEAANTLTGDILGHFISGQTVDDVETKARMSSQHRPIAYWDARRWPRQPNLPEGSWMCVNAYCGADESPATFEADMRRVLTEAGFRPLALVAQGYTQVPVNALYSNPAALVPVYARLLRDFPNIVACLVFSDFGRDGGMRGVTVSHPELQAPWTQLAATIRTPPLEEYAMIRKPEITVDKWTLDELANGKEFVFRDRENPELGYKARVFVREGSVFAELTNSAGTGVTGQRRPVKTVQPTPDTPPPDVPQPPEPPKPAPDVVTFETYNGKMLGISNGKLVVLPDTAAQFLPRRNPDTGRWGFKNVGSGRWMSAETGGQVTVNRVKPDDFNPEGWEAWEVSALPSGALTLKSDHGFYLTAWEDEVIANRVDVGEGEAFKSRLSVGGGSINPPLVPSGRIFTEAGKPWRWKGVTAFKLAERFRTGEDVTPFLRAFAGFNVLRVFSYVPNPPWLQNWDAPAFTVLGDFLKLVRDYGFYVEWVALTDDRSQNLGPARDILNAVKANYSVSNLLIEVGNEPRTNKNIDVLALRATVENMGVPYASGIYEDASLAFGTYLTTHTPRDGDWPRKAHDLMELYNGGGPNSPSDPPHKVPCVADEPIRPDQAGFAERDFYAYAAASSLFGAGATFHFENGKFGQLPSADEARCAEYFLRGLNLFPPDAPLGGYRSIPEKIDPNGSNDDPANFRTLRTYVVGNYMVRIRPKVLNAPEPGWVPLDEFGIAWRR